MYEPAKPAILPLGLLNEITKERLNNNFIKG
jgi:hypothetical protein